MRFGRYRQLLRRPGIPRVVASALVGRLPIGIFTLAIVLLVRHETDSFADAGIASAAWALGAGVAAPLQGRLVDRFGQPQVLIPSALLNAGSVGAFVLCAQAGSPTWVLAAFAWLGGAAVPPLGACMRSIWADVLASDASARNTAYTFESMTIEAFFIVGPAITTLLIAVSSQSGALLVAAALSTVGTLGFATAALARGWNGTHVARPRAGALAAPGMRTLMLAIVPTGVAFGVLEVALPAFAVAEGHPAASAGFFLSAMALGSLLGGLWYGARSWSGPIVTRFIGLEVLFTLGLLPLLIADSVGAMVVLMGIAGLALAPSAAAGYLLVDHVAPPGTATEATTWVMTANVAGTAVGAAVGGVLVQELSVRAALVLACAGPALGTVVALLRRRSLGERAAPVAVATEQRAA